MLNISNFLEKFSLFVFFWTNTTIQKCFKHVINNHFDDEKNLKMQFNEMRLRWTIYNYAKLYRKFINAKKVHEYNLMKCDFDKWFIIMQNCRELYKNKIYFNVVIVEFVVKSENISKNYDANYYRQ